jgi:hypothetical protein
MCICPTSLFRYLLHPLVLYALVYRPQLLLRFAKSFSFFFSHFFFFLSWSVMSLECLHAFHNRSRSKQRLLCLSKKALEAACRTHLTGDLGIYICLASNFKLSVLTKITTRNFKKFTLPLWRNVYTFPSCSDLQVDSGGITISVNEWTMAGTR